MAISLLTGAAGNADLDHTFDTYVSGTHPPATGLLDDTGVDIATRYAPLAVGTQAAATFLLTEQTGFADINTLFAKAGSSSYSIAIAGQTYSHTYTVLASTTGYSTIGFRLQTGTTWQVYGADPSTSGVSIATGNIPAGAATVLYTWGPVTTPAGYVSAGGVTSNGAAAATAIGSNPDAHMTSATVGPSSGSRESSATLRVQFYNSSSALISDSTCTLIVDTEGSV